MAVAHSVAGQQAPSVRYLLVVACVALGLDEAAEVSVEHAGLDRLDRLAVAVPDLVGIAVEVLVLALSDPKVSEQGVEVGRCWGQVCCAQSSCRE